MIPVLAFAALVALAGYKLGGNRKFHILKVGAAHPPTLAEFINSPNMTWEAFRGLPPARPPVQGYVAQLSNMAVQGLQPPPQLVQAALQEAMAAGDQATIQAIQSLFYAPPPMVMGDVLELPGDGEAMEVGGEPSAESWGESANPSQVPMPVPQPTPQPAKLEVPLPGVSPDQWGQFVAALRTKKPGWSNATHLGQFEHRRARVRELGLDDTKMSDPDSQYRALCADVQDRANNQQFLSTFVGRPVGVGGTDVVLTKSGVLGLLKAAGPAGAASWVENQQDRVKFPRTTEMLLRCNNCF